MPSALFTIIVLGESMLASTNAVIHAARSTEHLPSLVLIAVTALVIVACMWWIYFAVPQRELITSLRAGIIWGYGHFLLLIVRRQRDGAINAVMPVTAALILASAFGPYPMQVTAGLLVLLSSARSRSQLSIRFPRPADVPG